MGTIQDKKTKNERFSVAVDYLFQKKLVTSQKDLADKIGITGPSYSRIKNGVKNVSDDTIRKMNDAFKGIFNMAYFRGESGWLLAKDALMAGNNAEAVASAPICTEPHQPAPIDQSSLVNAALAAKDQTIAQMELRLSEKDETIRTQRQLIESLKQQVADLRYKNIIKNITDSPFPGGVAEP